MEIRQEHKLKSRQIRQISEIYSKSFPVFEQLPFSILEDSIRNQNRLLYIVEEGKEILGFAIVKPLSCEISYLLEYLAIKENKRSLGIGSTLLSHLIKSVSNRKNILGMLLEVEPIEGAPPDEARIRERRVHFYLKHGAIIVNEALSYCIPNLSGAGSIPMKLLWIPGYTTKSTISGKNLKECIISIYTDIYGTDQNNILLKSILDGLE